MTDGKNVGILFFAIKLTASCVKDVVDSISCDAAINRFAHCHPGASIPVGPPPPQYLTLSAIEWSQLTLKKPVIPSYTDSI
jgi:hypothetical protein